MSKEYVTLIGTEEVARAGRAMLDAADTIQRAVMSFEFQVSRLEQILREHADRLEKQ